MNVMTFMNAEGTEGGLAAAVEGTGGKEASIEIVEGFDRRRTD
jgi:hypothetical protein